MANMNHLAAQTCGTGSFYQLDTIHWAGLGQTVPPIRIFDNTGKEYMPSQQVVNPSLPFCEVGIFRLEFEDLIVGSPFFQDNTIYTNSGLSLGEMRRNLVCNVFRDLSNFLADVAPINIDGRVEIHVVSSSPFGGTASATPFFIVPNNIPTGLILDTEVEKTILSGQNSYLQYPFNTVNNSSLYHGFIEISPYEDWHCLENIPNNINPNDPILGGVDLYTVTLHEAIHLLGCLWTNVPPIAPPGALPCFSRYHKFLQYSNQTQVLSDIGGGNWIENPNPFTYTGCSAAGATYFNGFALLNQETIDPVLNRHHLRCEDITSPFAYSTSANNGHIPNFLVMSGGGFGPDFAKRHPAEEEKNLLCDLGYSFKSYTNSLPEWGTADPNNNFTRHIYTTSCTPPCNVVSISDRYDFFPQCTPPVLHITPLVNDINIDANTTISQVRVLTPNASAGTISNLNGTSFDFLPAAGLPNGWVVLSYVPVCSNGQDGGTAYIFINIQNNPLIIEKSIINTTPILFGDKINYEIRVCNLCPQGNVNGVVIEDIIDEDIYNILSLQTNDFVLNDNTLTSPPMDLAPGCTTLYVSIDYIGCEPIAPISNTASIVQINEIPITPISSTTSNAASFNTASIPIIIPFNPTGELLSNWINDFDALIAQGGGTVLVENNATLVIDVPYHFENLAFRMSSGSEILIQPDGITKMTNCHLFGCGRLWKGIQVETSAQLRVHHCIVRDAEFGILVNDFTKVVVDKGSVFRNNYIGIYVPENVNVLFNNIYLLVENTVFEGTSNLLAPYTNITSVVHEKPLAGMLINNLIFSINNNVNFRHLSNGILAHNCELTLSKVFFEDIHDDPSSPYHTQAHGTTGLMWNSTGTALVHYNGSAVLNIGHNMIAGVVTIGAGSGTLPYGFVNCDFGIVTHNSRLKAINNTMIDMGAGIYNFLANYHYIQSNTIKARFVGVMTDMPDFSPSNEIANNHFEIHNPVGGASSRGILLQAWSSGATTRIYGNSIEMENARSGIEVSGAEGIKVYQNAHINMNVVPPFACYGIHVSGTANGYFGCNGIRGVNAGNSGSAYVGMHFAQSIGNIISCNLTNATAKGIEFTGICDAPNQFIGNEMKDHFWGLFLTGSGSMGQQNYTGNMWTGNYGSTFGAENNGNVLPIVVNGTNPIFLPAFNPPNWFIQDTLPDVGCSSTECGGANNIIASGLNEFDYKTANNEIEDSLYQVEFQYAADKHLYNKLLESPNLLPATGAIHDFYTENQNSNVKKLSEIEQEQAEIQNHILLQQLTAIQEDIETIKEQLRIADSLFLVNNDSSFISSRDSFETVLQNLHSQNTTLSAQAASYIATQSNLSIAKNTTVIDSTLYESNEKQINDIYLTTIGQRNFQFNSNEISIISNIAHQCPYTGGMAVYKARTLYGLFYPYELYDDTEACSSQNVNWRKNNTKEVNPEKVSIYPNPAHDVVIVELSKSSDYITNIVIYDIMGRVLEYLSIRPDETQTTIKLGTYSKGMYEINIIENHKIIHTQKIIID